MSLVTELPLQTCMLAYSSGTLAAVSPCVVVLIPLLLFRFVQPKEQDATRQRGMCAVCFEVLQFVVGFQSAYAAFGLVVSSLLTSSAQNGFKAGLGAFFAVSGSLAVNDRIDPMSLPLFQHPVLLGVAFAVLVSVNPCTVPFLAVVITLSTTEALLALLCFGFGLLTPALLFVMLGRGFVRALRSWRGVMHAMNKVMSIVLIGAGYWLVYSVVVQGTLDYLVTAVLQTLTVAMAMKSFYLFDLGRSYLYLAVVAIALLSVAGYCAFLRTHDTETHELLAPVTMAEDATGSVCVDVSLVEPCEPCVLCKVLSLALVSVTCAVIFAVSARARSAAHECVLPSHAPHASGTRHAWKAQRSCWRRWREGFLALFTTSSHAQAGFYMRDI